MVGSDREVPVPNNIALLQLPITKRPRFRGSDVRRITPIVKQVAGVHLPITKRSHFGIDENNVSTNVILACTPYTAR